MDLFTAKGICVPAQQAEIQLTEQHVQIQAWSLPSTGPSASQREIHSVPRVGWVAPSHAQSVLQSSEFSAPPLAHLTLLWVTPRAANQLAIARVAELGRGSTAGQSSCQSWVPAPRPGRGDPIPVVGAHQKFVYF